MKLLNFKFLFCFVLVAGVFIGCLEKDNIVPTSTADFEEANFITYASNVISGQYIVVYKEEAAGSKRAMQALNYNERQSVMKDEAVSTLRTASISTDKLGQVYGTALQGFSAKLTLDEVEALRRNSDIDYIEQDQILSVTMGGPPGGGGDGGSSPAQQTPWGITRVGGAVNGASGTAWVLDTGVDLDHEDLNVDAGRSWSAFTKGKDSTPDDGQGHGTHVAGTIAAIDNGVGVVGVAAGATVVAVKVLDSRGSGSNSGVIAGVNYVAANASSNDVANMSLGGGVSTALDNAVVAASSACPFSLAAGNESQHANNSSPARANGNNIYTVSSMTSSDSWSSFSNYGNPPVDYVAPGSSILSTYKSGGYATLSGTSMAAPHVAGILLLGNVSSDGNVSGDPDGDADPIAHH